MTGPVAEQTLRAVISWGRYAGAFAFDDEKNAAQPWKPALTSLTFLIRFEPSQRLRLMSGVYRPMKNPVSFRKQAEPVTPSKPAAALEPDIEP